MYIRILEYLFLSHKVGLLTCSLPGLFQGLEVVCTEGIKYNAIHVINDTGSYYLCS